MKISVERSVKSCGALEFLITVSEPHLVPFGEKELEAMSILDESKKVLDDILGVDNSWNVKYQSTLLEYKMQVFEKLISSLNFSIKNQLSPKFNPICVEIYNWIRDHQEGKVLEWMEDFDPQRTKYYFDNDTTIESDY